MKCLRKWKWVNLPQREKSLRGYYELTYKGGN